MQQPLAEFSRPKKLREKTAQKLEARKTCEKRKRVTRFRVNALHSVTIDQQTVQRERTSEQARIVDHVARSSKSRAAKKGRKLVLYKYYFAALSSCFFRSVKSWKIHVLLVVGARPRRQGKDASHLAGSTPKSGR